MTDAVRGLDRWIEGDVPDPGSGNGEPSSVPKLTCLQCDFRGTFSNAAHHHEISGHTVLFRGVAQVFGSADAEIRAYHEKFYGTEQIEKKTGAA